jgi:hypothetical protein
MANYLFIYYNGGGANGGGTEFNTAANSGKVEAAAQAARPAFQTKLSPFS